MNVAWAAEKGEARSSALGNSDAGGCNEEGGAAKEADWKLGDCGRRLMNAGSNEHKLSRSAPSPSLIS